MQALDIPDAIVDGVDYTLTALAELLFGSSPRALFDIETIDSDTRFICKRGDFLTVINIVGCGSVVGNAEYNDRVQLLNEGFVTKLASAGHRIKVFYESDPDSITKDLEDNFSAARTHAKDMGLEVDDLIDEKIAANAKFCQREKVTIAFYTSKDILTKRDSTVNSSHLSAEKKSIGLGVGKAQNILSYFETIRSLHSAAVESLISSLTVSGLETSVLTVDSVLRSIVEAMKGRDYAKSWAPDTLAWGQLKNNREIRAAGVVQKKTVDKLTSNKIARYLHSVTGDNNSSLEPILPRSIADQVLPDDITTPSGLYVVCGRRIYAPVSVTKFCDAPADFERLLGSLRGTPFRIAFTLTPNGLAGDYIASVLASTLSWVPGNNGQIKASRDSLKKYIKNETHAAVCGLSITASTWAPLKRVIQSDRQSVTYNTLEIESRSNKLQTAFSNWGSSQAATSFGDPVEVLYSTIPGMNSGHVSLATPAPIKDVCALLPTSRTVTPWSSGAMLYRSPDGTAYPYAQTSSKQSAGVTLIFGPMGYSKTSTINALNLAFLLEPSSNSELPYLRGIDFGYGSKGVVDIMKSALGKDNHKAQYLLLLNDRKFGYNVFDLPLGNRIPLPNHFAFLKNFFLSVCRDLERYSNLEGLIVRCINEAYKKYTDHDYNTGAKSYYRGTDRRVDEVIDKYGLEVHDAKTTWYSVVDFLASKGHFHEAGLASRYTVPTLQDIGGVATSTNVRSEYHESIDGIPVVELFARSIREATDKYAFLSGVTQFDISDSPIVCLDLKDLLPTGSGGDDRTAHDAAIVFLFATRLLTADFFVDASYLPYFNPKYRNYHETRIRRLTSLKKRFFIDEKHKAKGVKSAENQFDAFITEGRKFVIDSLQGSQVFDDFSKKIVGLATTIAICGSGSPQSTREIAEHYDLNSTHTKILDRIRKPGAAGAEALMIFKTTFGRQVLSTMNTEGPLMLCAIATEAPDRVIRAGLYQRSPTQAIGRAIFAKAFPLGSVKPELERRIALRAEGLYEFKTSGKQYLEDILEELTEKYLS
jgi:intracellular multiplication protein IcmB